MEFAQIPRSQNVVADEITKLASFEEGPTSMDLKMEIQKCPNIKEVSTFAIQSVSSWMTLILSFLQDRSFPQNVEEARKVKKKAVRFTILNDNLYKRSFSTPYLKCIDKEEAKYILEEIHEGIYGDHVGPEVLGRQSDQKRLLLAYFADGCKRVCQEMRQMLKVWECSTPPSRETNVDSLPQGLLRNGEMTSSAR